MLKTAIAVIGLTLAIAAPQQSSAMPLEDVVNAAVQHIDMRSTDAKDYMAVSEPATLGVLGFALVGLSTLRRRKPA